MFLRLLYLEQHFEGKKSNDTDFKGKSCFVETQHTYMYNFAMIWNLMISYDLFKLARFFLETVSLT